jgi:hypothetical protein
MTGIRDFPAPSRTRRNFETETNTSGYYSLTSDMGRVMTRLLKRIGYAPTRACRDVEKLKDRVRARQSR